MRIDSAYAGTIAAAKREIFDRLDRIQSGDASGVLIMKADPTGLGAQISRRVLGLRLGLHYNRTVVFTRDDDFPYVQSFQRMHSVEVAEQWDRVPDLNLDGIANEGARRFNFWKWWDDPGRDVRFTIEVPHCLREVPDASLIYDGILALYLKLKPEWASYVEERRRELKIDTGVVGLHVRRGDKNVETPYVSLDTYRRSVEAVLMRLGGNRVFLASDDPKVVARLSRVAHLEILYDAGETRRNNANHRFLMKHPEFALDETRTAIKNIMLLASCGMIVGQRNAHFASLAASMICASRCTPEFGELIAPDIMFQRAPLRRLSFFIKQQPRRVAKQIFKNRTIRSIPYR